MNRCITLAIAGLFVLAAGFAPAPTPAPVRAAEAADEAGVPDLDAAWHAGRRAALASRIPEGIILVRGSTDTNRCEGFRQNNDFYYLTGVEVPDAALLMVPARGVEILFLPDRNPAEERWKGPQPGPDEATARACGFAEVVPLRKLLPTLEAITAEGTPLWTPLGPEEIGVQNADTQGPIDRIRQKDPLDGRPARAQALKAAIESRFPGVQVRDAGPDLAALRARKTPEELALLREACRITCESIAAALRKVRPGWHEHTLAGHVDGGYRIGGAERLAFGTISGSGPNSTVLHYMGDRRRMESGDIVVLDTGAEYHYYAADVTRTFPVSGKFTPRQREIYQAVRDAQQAVLDELKPGMTFRQIEAIVRKTMTARKLEKYLIHGTSHFIGLAVHDVGDYSKPLEEGMVISVEPGLYLPDEQIGVRIEDTVALTRDGCEILSKDCPRTADEIESIMNAGSRPEAD